MKATSSWIGKVFAVLLIMAVSVGFMDVPAASPVNRKVMVVFLKLSPPFCSNEQNCTPNFPPVLRNEIRTPRHSAAGYENMLNFTITNYIMEATYSNSHLEFDAIANPNSADGWFDAPHSLEAYNEPEGDEDADAYMGEDAFNLAYATIGNAVQNYDILLVVNNIQFIYGFTASFGPYPLVVMGENPGDNEFYEVAAHELGHVHGLYHVKMGPYDIVGDSDVLTHYGGYSKVYAGWATGVTDMPCIGGPCEITTTLDALERPGNNVLRIPFTNLPGKHFIGYYAECRAKISFDGNIPEEGVVITKIDTVSDPDLPAKIVFPLNDGNYADAALSPGETFVDKAQSITITYVSKEGSDRCKIKASRGPIVAPDPLIYAGAEHTAGAAFTEYSSNDIWIDSQENGWGEYPFGTTYSSVGGQGVPVGPGDPFWVNHENRIKFLIRNKGFSDAEHVMVDVYVTQPITLNVAGTKCEESKPISGELVGTVEIDHLEKDGFYFGEVPWTPTENSTAEVEVVIRDYVGEITHSNNTARETYARQNVIVNTIGDIDAEKIKSVIDLPLTFNLQADPKCRYDFHYRFTRKVISAIEKKYWVTDMETLEGKLIPGKDVEVPLASIPPEDVQPGDCEQVAMDLKILMDDVFVPVDGLVYETCAVEPTTLTCIVPKEMIKVGNDVTVKGVLTPAEGGEKIALEYTDPKGRHTIRLVTAGSDGAYTDILKSDQSGQWQFQAFWQGTKQNAPAESGLCKFQVTSGGPELTLNYNSNCRSGPGTDFSIVTWGKKGEVVQIQARNADSSWLYGTLNGDRCWISRELGNLNVNVWVLPIREAPASPSGTGGDSPSAPAAPSVCSTYTSQLTCNRYKSQCVWADGVCKAK